MELKDRIKCAKNYLDEANKQVDAGNYMSARACLADAYSQTRALIDEVQKLVLTKKGHYRPAAGSKK